MISSIRTAAWMGLIFSALACQAQTNHPWVYDTPEARRYAQDQLAQMTDAQKVGQLFMVAAYSNKGPEHAALLEKYVRENHLGGVIYMQGGPGRQWNLNQRLQQAAKVPLLVAMDAEWDLGMRLDSTTRLPWPMTLGATGDSSLAYAYGQTIARHAKRLGVHVNFGPVLDVNTNPSNPIIGQRSFGQRMDAVIPMAHGYLRGMQDAGVLDCAKHFPGHGDTDSDSHKTLPTVLRSRAALDSVELRPFKALLPHAGSVMVAHLNVPALEPAGISSSLSKKVISGVLRDEMGFQGLVFTDALNMRGAADGAPTGPLEEKALRAGNDVLLFTEDFPKASAHLLAVAKSDRELRERIEESVLRILMAKYHLVVRPGFQAPRAGLESDLIDPQSRALTADIFAKALTVAQAQSGFEVRSGRWASPETAVLTVANKAGVLTAPGVLPGSPGIEARAATSLGAFTHEGALTPETVDRLVAATRGRPVVLEHRTSNDSPWKSAGVPEGFDLLVKRLVPQGVVVVHYGSPYGLRNKDFTGAQAVLVAYQNHPAATQAVREFLAGQRSASGVLPVDLGVKHRAGTHQPVPARGQVVPSTPEHAGFQSGLEPAIDAIVQEGLAAKAYPGCQVVVVRNGKIALNKGYGTLDYAENSPSVAPETWYDVASLTKILGSVPALLVADARGWFSPNDRMDALLPELKNTPLGSVKAVEVLTHQAGLPAGWPFDKQVLKDGAPDPYWLSNQKSDVYSLRAADSLWVRSTWPDTVVARISRIPLGPKTYLYSDLGYYLFQRFLERKSGTSLSDFVEHTVWEPAGISDLRYGPFLTERSLFHPEIAPTEAASDYRKGILRGSVHDPGAALMGGVAGHAGIFGTARGVAAAMELFLAHGDAGTQRVFEAQDVDDYTRCIFCSTNRRGIGFDKRPANGDGPTCGCVSVNSYGHTGYTGTYAWADPETQTVYVFLSNRVHPSADNKKLANMNIRTRIQQVIQDHIRP
jgi:beta-glucosidase-like glycosyl hydrolase/CubicO group peptidase (beta-lactamase class C family)